MASNFGLEMRGTASDKAHAVSPPWLPSRRRHIGRGILRARLRARITACAYIVSRPCARGCSLTRARGPARTRGYPFRARVLTLAAGGICLTVLVRYNTNYCTLHTQTNLNGQSVDSGSGGMVDTHGHTE